MVWVGDDASDSDYEVLEEPTSTPAPSSVSRQGVWNPSKLSLVLLFLSKRGVELDPCIPTPQRILGLVP